MSTFKHRGRTAAAPVKPRQLRQTQLRCSPLLRLIGKNFPAWVPFSQALLSDTVWHGYFAQDITGLGEAATTDNLSGLGAGLETSLRLPHGRLKQPWAGECTFEWLPHRRAVRDAAAHKAESIAAAKAAFPELVRKGNLAGLADAARRYREQRLWSEGKPSQTVRLAHITVPLHRTKPAVLVCTLEEVHRLLMHLQDLSISRRKV